MFISLLNEIFKLIVRVFPSQQRQTLKYSKIRKIDIIDTQAIRIPAGHVTYDANTVTLPSMLEEMRLTCYCIG